jgi:hypothetical protein
MIKLLILLAGLGYGALQLVRLRDRWTRRLLSILPTPRQPFAVTIEAPGGRGGSLDYREDAGGGRFGWEVEGIRRSVLRVTAPGAAAWDRELPWAAGRRQQILARVAEEMVRQKCPGYRWEIDDSGVSLRA